MQHTVLLVDDDERLLAGLLRALKKQPFRIFTARNGEEAIWILKTREIDVVVADQRMSGMSGIDLLAWIAENNPDVMRIVLTGHAETDMAIRAINEVGVCYFFTKPCNEARLAVAIQKAIELKDAVVSGRQALAASHSQLRDVERLNQDLELQTRIIFHDFQRPLEQMEKCRDLLEEQCRKHPNDEAQSLLAEVQLAADEARRLAAQLQHLAES